MSFIISQVQSVALTAIRIRQGGTRDKNIESGLNWFPIWNRVSKIESFDEQSFYDIIKTIIPNNYVRSFFGNDGEDCGKLMHEFKMIPPHKGAPQNAKNRFYIKFITPDSILNPDDIYEEYEPYKGAFKKAGILEENIRNNESND